MLGQKGTSPHGVEEKKSSRVNASEVKILLVTFTVLLELLETKCVKPACLFQTVQIVEREAK